MNPPLVKTFSKVDRNGKLTVFRFYEGRSDAGGLSAFCVESTEVPLGGIPTVRVKEARLDYSADMDTLSSRWEDWVVTRLGCSLELPLAEDLSSRKAPWGTALWRAEGCLCPLTRAFFFCVVRVRYTMGENLLAAYREYLERMLSESDELVEVDVDTVPEGVQCSLTWLEWANFA